MNVSDLDHGILEVRGNHFDIVAIKGNKLEQVHGPGLRD
jgi:hypothetical protein